MDGLLRIGFKNESQELFRLVSTLADTAGAFARLDQVTVSHPLAPAILFRARLEAVRRIASAEGNLIDPWHLAAHLEGLKVRMADGLSIFDRGQIFEAGRFSLGIYQWLVFPDLDQEAYIEAAEAHLAAFPDHGGPVLTAGFAFHRWIEKGGARLPIWSALVRYWGKTRLLGIPLPLVGAAALAPETPWELNQWLTAFLTSLAKEATWSLQLALDLDRSWRKARIGTAKRKKGSHFASAVDCLAAAPLMSATSLARTLGISVKSAINILAARRSEFSGDFVCGS
jgi:hypothetical protein